MEIGSLFRQRRIKAYGTHPRNFFEFVADQEQAKDLKRVFVTMLIGTEGFELVNKKGEQVMEPLDVERAMNTMGWWSEKQIEAALRRKGGRSVVDRLHVWLNKKLKAQKE